MKFNHLNLFSDRLNDISIHFPLNKKRAHGSASSHFAGEFLTVPGADLGVVRVVRSNPLN